MSAKEKIQKYWNETQLEIKKVAWPTKDEMIGSTIATIVISTIVAAFIWVVDKAISAAVFKAFQFLG